jgi:hypothetical protein
MRARSAAQAAWLTIVGTFALALVASCGGGGSGDGNAGGGSGGSGGAGGTPPPSLPTTTSSSQSAYATATASGWQVVPLLTVGDMASDSTYAMVGKPDGLGAIAGRVTSSGEIVESDRYFTVFMNHELPGNRGAVRGHGTKGAFVSQWTIDLDTLRTTGGRDLISRVTTFRNGAWADATGTTTFDRLCSADLPPMNALFNAQSGKGYQGRLFLTGEEIVEGLAYATVIGGSAHGDTYELPYLGKYSHENVIAHPASGDTTLVVSPDDDGPGQVYVYVGTKRTTGNPAERAGLHGGRLYGIRVTDGGTNYSGGAVARENKGAISGRFELVDVSDAALGTGANLQSVSLSRGITEFARPEDGAWDTRDALTFYLATTGQNIDATSQTARLYRLVFDSLEQPTGGTIELALDAGSVTAGDGSAGKGFDNVTVDAAGRVFVMEDGGNDSHVSKVWMFNPSGGQATPVIEADRNRFLTGGSGFLTVAEEHSGVIEVTDQVRNANWFETGRRYYLGTLQAHYPLNEMLFEGGQLYLFVSPRS